MSTATATVRKDWTEAELLAMPDDGVERWIINGQLREKPSEYPEATMTVRNRHHCRVVAALGKCLVDWIRLQPKPRGRVYGGNVGVVFPELLSVVGIDVVYASAEIVEQQDDDVSSLLVGVPTLTVEILSPNDYQEQIHEKTREYLQAGVPIVWVIDPDDQTVKVYRSGVPAESFNITHRLPEHPAMPGFAPTVAELFE